LDLAMLAHEGHFGHGPRKVCHARRIVNNLSRVGCIAAPTRGWHPTSMTVQLDEGIILPRASVRFPIELKKSSRMRADDPATWPRVEGRLEYVGGKLLYMP